MRRTSARSVRFPSAPSPPYCCGRHAEAFFMHSGQFIVAPAGHPRAVTSTFLTWVTGGSGSLCHHIGTTMHACAPFITRQLNPHWHGHHAHSALHSMSAEFSTRTTHTVHPTVTGPRATGPYCPPGLGPRAIPWGGTRGHFAGLADGREGTPAGGRTGGRAGGRKPNAVPAAAL